MPRKTAELPKEEIYTYFSEDYDTYTLLRVAEFPDISVETASPENGEETIKALVRARLASLRITGSTAPRPINPFQTYLRLYNEGHTLPSIANAAGVSRQAVHSSLLRRECLKEAQYHSTDEDVNKIKELHSVGKSGNAISKTLGIPITAVHRICKQNNLGLRGIVPEEERNRAISLYKEINNIRKTADRLHRSGRTIRKVLAAEGLVPKEIKHHHPLLSWQKDMIHKLFKTMTYKDVANEMGLPPEKVRSFLSNDLAKKRKGKNKC